jgi:hypothetical protein
MVSCPGGMKGLRRPDALFLDLATGRLEHLGLRAESHPLARPAVAVIAAPLPIVVASVSVEPTPVSRRRGLRTPQRSAEFAADEQGQHEKSPVDDTGCHTARRDSMSPAQPCKFYGFANHHAPSGTMGA